MGRREGRAVKAVNPLLRFGLWCALAACAVDLLTKFYILEIYGLPSRGVVPILPVLDFVFVRNRGISYGLFQQDSELGQWLLVAFKAGAVILLTLWLARAANRLTALSLGLIIGGAVGNAVDRLIHGWVTDFVLFHVEIGGSRFNWYVFNLADVAIVAGVIGLLYESLIGVRAAKAP